MSKPSQEPSEEPIADASIEDFCALASRFIEVGKFDEAIEVYQRARRIFPDSIALKINLGRIRNLRQEHEENQLKDLDRRYADQRRRQDLLAIQFNSLGTSYMQRDQTARAVEMFEMAKTNNPNLPRPFQNMGTIYYRNNEFSLAAKELKKALDCDPFEEDVNRLLGRSLFYLKKYRLALNALLDAFILSGGKDSDRTSSYQSKIRYLFEILGIDNKTERKAIIKERTQRLNRLAMELDGEREKYRETHQVADVLDLLVNAQKKKEIQRELLQLALRLKNFSLLSALSDEDLFRVAKNVLICEIDAEQTIFSHGESSDELYLIETGQVRVIRQTPFGEQVLATIKAGEFFGEINFIDGEKRSADAVAEGATTLLAMSRAEMMPLFETNKNLAVQFFWHFWKNLARRTRESNDLLKTFFQDSAQATLSRGTDQAVAAAQKISIELDRKIEILEKPGLLSARELRLLATFSQEELYHRGDVLFREGSSGDKLYIILDGQVRISKQIAGVGDEALAILEAGDFFGEMALVDQGPRSADAFAHSENLTLLAISHQVLNEILRMDIDSAYQFLSILCRILTKRLREINLKIIQWRMMSGGF
jgi:CRP-like cAMP-binding protein/Tfp pilus assembly protein PilF